MKSRARILSSSRQGQYTSIPRHATVRTCVVVVFGVTGSGKSRIGASLAKALGWTFSDADDFHGQKNLAKLQRGVPLTDDDRWPWLNRLRRVIKRCLVEQHSMVLACSALKRMYRQHLCIGNSVIFVYLKAEPALIKHRLQKRKGHFMNPDLLHSQFETLEEPMGDAIVVNAADKPRDIVNSLRALLLFRRLDTVRAKSQPGCPTKLGRARDFTSIKKNLS